MVYLYLLIAILSEIVATSALKATDGFSRVYPAIIVAFGYITSFYLLSLTLKTLPIGIVYAIWSGLGIAGIAAIGVFYYGESFTLWHGVGMGFILLGVFILNFLTMAH